MRFPNWLLTAIAALATTAVAATAQDTTPPAETKAEPTQRLQDIEAAVDQALQEEQQPTEQPAEAQPETPTESPAQPAEPRPEPPATTPAQPATPPATATPSAPPPPLTREQIATLDRTVARGRLLVAIARAGLVATQDMLTRISDPSGAGISGWIAEPAGNAMLVTFYALGEGETAAPKAVYRVNILGGRVTSREIYLGDDRPDLTPIQARMARARAASDSDALRACTSQPFNVLVVPPTTSGAAIDVYRVSTQAERGRLPAGGHFRSTVASDGTVETHAYASTCAMLDLPPAVEGQPPRPVGLTHLADPLPTEIHMFLAQSAGRPLLVVAGEPQRLWIVTGEAIAEIRDRQQRTP